MRTPNFLVFVDFDSTLFSHQQFGDDWRRSLAQAAGISFEQFAADETALRAANANKYSVTQHAALYGLSRQRVARLFRELAAVNQYLFADAPEFMTRLRAAGLQPMILTFGSKLYQEAKIKPNLDRLTGGLWKLDYRAIDEPKGEYIAAHFPGRHGVLVDDVADQGLPIGFTEVHLDRGHQRREPQRLANRYEVSDLLQAAAVIQGLIQG